MQHFAMHSDGSGAPCVIESHGYVFAFDYLGEVKCNLISNHSRLGKNHRIALQECKAAYIVQMGMQPDIKEFLEKNQQFYPSINAHARKHE